MKRLILGGARSGKSALAERLTQQHAGTKPVQTLVTAEATDQEMAERIRRHQADRPSHWLVTEAPLNLAEAIEAQPAESWLLVDCMTLWLNNQLYRQPNQDLNALFECLTDVLSNREQWLLVSNEVGLGIVPGSPEVRRFADWQGRLNQALAGVADQVVFTAAGLPLTLKGPAL